MTQPNDFAKDLAAAVGRLIMPAIRAEDPTSFALAEELASPGRTPGGIGAGGFLVFGGERATLPARLAAVRDAAGGRPLLFAADLERGAGQQVAGLTRLPHLMALGAAGSLELSRRAGLTTAREARVAGLHLVFAPVVDLNTDPRNPIINIRSFGDDAFKVGRLAAAWIKGCREGGALSCAKHFPGHGHTAVDSHLALPRLAATLPAMMARELLPFGLVCAGTEAVDAVMTAHMAVPSLTGDPDLPVTLSPRAILHLRHELAFGGLVVTDALLMGGITASFDEAEAGWRALAAGCDILLCPADPRRLHATVLSAVRDGRVPEARVREALGRLDRAIEARGASAEAPRGEAAPDPGGGALAAEIAAAALTRVRGEPPSGAAQVLVLVSGDAGEAGGDLAAEVHRHSPATRLLPVVADSPDERLATVATTVAEAARSGERVAIALFSKVLAWKGASGLPEREARLVEDLCALAPGAAVIACGSPYLLEHARRAAFTACGFSDEPASQRAAAAALLAEAGYPGKSPVALGALAGG